LSDFGIDTGREINGSEFILAFRYTCQIYLAKVHDEIKAKNRELV
jgi:hypothetical protein